MRTLIAALSLLTLTIASHAEASHVIVHATKESTGSISFGDVASLTAKFNVVISNATAEDIDLEKGCFVLSNDSVAPTEGDVFFTDTIDEKLTKGKLAPNVPVGGFVVFAGENPDILDAHFVHYLPNCLDK